MLEELQKEFATGTLESIKLISITLKNLSEIVKDQGSINDAQAAMNKLFLEAINRIDASIKRIEQF